ncbi:hypothetical protein B5V03_40700 [Bradyrhizobium betae]|uniref:Uncharacterized protein n=1 Tax=Bradyrhizobium betae TaxID=244734 RepID=A0A4Q1UIU1_9BRAD|nr:hypothetical protein B5V03_40700 [Bradyrhizobium betae]
MAIRADGDDRAALLSSALIGRESDMQLSAVPLTGRNVLSLITAYSSTAMLRWAASTVLAIIASF